MSDNEEELSEEEYMEALEEAQEVVKSAITSYLQVAKQTSLLVTKFAVVAETYQTVSGGQVEAKSLVHFVDNMSPWDASGMLGMVSKDIWMDSRESSYMYSEDDEDD